MGISWAIEERESETRRRSRKKSKRKKRRTKRSGSEIRYQRRIDLT
jgi:hypothetical protein